jgi:hypothetical protein
MTHADAVSGSGQIRRVWLVRRLGTRYEYNRAEAEPLGSVPRANEVPAMNWVEAAAETKLRHGTAGRLAVILGEDRAIYAWVK